MFDNSSEEFKGSWIPEGFQVKKIRRPRKDIPLWANNDKKLKLRIFKSAMRRYRIAYLYWRVGMNAREISLEMHIKKQQVYDTIRFLKKGLE